MLAGGMEAWHMKSFGPRSHSRDLRMWNKSNLTRRLSVLVYVLFAFRWVQLWLEGTACGLLPLSAKQSPRGHLSRRASREHGIVSYFTGISCLCYLIHLIGGAFSWCQGWKKMLPGRKVRSQWSAWPNGWSMLGHVLQACMRLRPWGDVIINLSDLVKPWADYIWHHFAPCYTNWLAWIVGVCNCGTWKYAAMPCFNTFILSVTQLLEVCLAQIFEWIQAKATETVRREHGTCSCRHQSVLHDIWILNIKASLKGNISKV